MDSMTSRSVATIINSGQSWNWKRETSLLLHGAPPAEGICDGLIKAKIKVLAAR
jgi:hypothetical protein